MSLTIRDGKVTLKAEQASLRQILAEWERQGQVKIVGADKLVGAPLTLTLVDVPEKQALEIVMRGVPGYMAVDRVAQADAPAGPSRFDRVVVMARAATPGGGRSPASLAGSRGMPVAGAAADRLPADHAGDRSRSRPRSATKAPSPAGPDRNDVEQFQQVEPPMPDAPGRQPVPERLSGLALRRRRRQQRPYGGNPRRPPRPASTRRRPRRSSTTRTRRSTSSSGRQQQAAAADVGADGGADDRRHAARARPAARRWPAPIGRPDRAGRARPAGRGAGAAAAPTPAQGEFFNPYNLPGRLGAAAR